MRSVASEGHRSSTRPYLVLTRCVASPATSTAPDRYAHEPHGAPHEALRSNGLQTHDAERVIMRHHVERSTATNCLQMTNELERGEMRRHDDSRR